MSKQSCVNCSETLRGHDSFALPIGANADVVGVNFTGEWGGVPCCEDCHTLHAAIKIPNDPTLESAIARDVLERYAAIVDRRTKNLHAAREALRDVEARAHDTLNVVGWP